MTPAQQQRKELAKRARRYTRRQPNYEGINGREIQDAIAAAYTAGYRAARTDLSASIKHVLDNGGRVWIPPGKLS